MTEHTPAAATPDPADDGKGGKAAVLADLATERDKRQALEQQVRDLQQAQQTQTDALAQAFGLKPEDTSDVSKLAHQIGDLQRQFAETQHANSVLSLANEFRITEKGDLDLLASVTDPSTMRNVAARIAKTADSTPGTPKPDLSQGGSSGAPLALNGDPLEASLKQALGIA